MDEYDGLCHEELLLLEFGNSSEQIKWCVSMIQVNNPIITNRTNIYKAAGFCLKKYGFRSTALACKRTGGLTDDNVFPKLRYAAKSYYSSETASKIVSSEDVPNILEKNRKEADVARVREMCNDYENSLVDMLIKGRITKDEYDSVKDSKEDSIGLIKKVYG
jgi:hypothetical protein